MILNKKTREGWLLIDHTASPGIPGMAPRFEVATYRCSHCERQVIRNPARTRERAWCSNCDKYICDQCEAVRAIEGCKPFDAKLEAQINLVSKLGEI